MYKASFAKIDSYLSPPRLTSPPFEARMLTSLAPTLAHLKFTKNFFFTTRMFIRPDQDNSLFIVTDI